MSDIMELALDYAPFALLCAIVLMLLFLLGGNLLLRKCIPLWWIVLTSAYAGLLFAGTLRVGSLRELFRWEKPFFWDIGYQFSLNAHDLYNVALFIPWGALGMMRAKEVSTSIICLATGAMASIFIETYQLFHLRSFDLGDVMTNIAGCTIGILIMIPFMLVHRVRAHQKTA